MPEENNLIIWAMSGAENAALSSHLQMAAARTESPRNAQNCPDFLTAQAALVTDEAAKLCLIYTAPEHILSQAFQDGEDPARALADWADAARQILSLHRHNRRRSLLFEATHLRRYFNVGLTRLGLQTSNLTLDMPPQKHSINMPLLGMIAHGHLQDRREAIALREELDASAQLLSNDAVLVPPLSAGLALQNFYALRLRLAEAEQSDEKARGENLRNLKTVEDLRAEVAEAETRLRQHQARFNQIRTDHENKLKDTERRLHKSESRLQKSEDHVQILKLEIDRIARSRSMRVTAPLRRLYRVLGKSFRD